MPIQLQEHDKYLIDLLAEDLSFSRRSGAFPLKSMITACGECGTERLNHTWTKLDFVTMAKKSGALAQLLVPAYYSGVREGHSTVGAIFSRLDAEAAEAGEGLVFDGSSQPKRADVALLTAHKIILMVLDLHKNHFHLAAMEEPLQNCVSDLFAIWDKKPDADASSTST